MKLAEKILSALSRRDGQSDHDLAMAIDGNDARMSQIGSECRHLAGTGKLFKQMRADGIMGNFLGRKITASVPKMP